MKKYLSMLLSVVMICALLAGCGASSDSVADYKMEAAMEAPAEMAMDNGMGLTEESGSTSADLPESRKWIITVYISAETDDLDTLTASLNEKITSLNGYVEDQSIYNGSTYASRRYRNANMTIRIPAEDVDRFTEEVAGIANVVTKEKNLEDVTLSYSATENRVKALETEEARLLELLAQAENMTDLLEIEARLTDVRYELENYASQLRLYDNQIDYATIHLSIKEVQEYTPVEEPTLWERISGGFTDSLSGLGESLQDVLVFVVVAAPFLVVYGAIAVVIVVVANKLRKKRRAKKAAKKAAKEAAKDEKKEP